VYVKYRWAYDARAVDQLFESGSLTEGSSIADVGAGPGNLTARLLPRARVVYAIEPNEDMREEAEEAFSDVSNFRSIQGSAESTGLDAGCVDAITVGRALQWFAAPRALREFSRIGRAPTILGVFRVAHRPSDVEVAETALHCEACGWDIRIGRDVLLGAPARRPLGYFFAGGRFRSYVYANAAQESWEAFLGRLSSHSGAPLPGTVRFARLEQGARRVFDRFAEAGVLSVPCETRLYVGELRDLGS